MAANFQDDSYRLSCNILSLKMATDSQKDDFFNQSDICEYIEYNIW